MLENEIARLTAENAALKKESSRTVCRCRRAPLRNRVRSRRRAHNGVTLQLPSDADIDRMVAYAGRLWHRFVDAVERAESRS